MKHYAINWENDEVVSIEIDGEFFTTPDEIPNQADREAIQNLMDKHFEVSFAKEFGSDFDAKFDKDFRQMGADESARGAKIMVGIFLAVALLMILIAVISTIFVNRKLDREISASGQVVDLISRTDQEGQLFYYPLVTFELADGSSQTVQIPMGSSNPNYAYGDAVTILYDAENPTNARIDSSGGTFIVWLVPFITGILGLGFLATALLVYRFTKPDPYP